MCCREKPAFLNGCQKSHIGKITPLFENGSNTILTPSQLGEQKMSTISLGNMYTFKISK